MITAPDPLLDVPAPDAGTAAYSATHVVPFVSRLADHGDRVAVVTADVNLTYRELASRVDGAARRLGSERRLILIEGSNDLDTLVWYLGALAARNVVVLVPGGNVAAARSIVDAYDPDVRIRAVADRRPATEALDETRLDERRAVTAHDLHPDLALLLSTSGSTGSPKLVRLSHDNLQANAEAIATYLDIRVTDRAASTLPLHYCYGLSVVHSHLVRGAGIVLTDLSVVDACFWDLARETGVTTLAGVPHTFDLLDRVGFAEMALPALRYITQAGGRLAPETVLRYAELGQRSGFDLVVMYGATEATARMAYLPPQDIAANPGAIGVPIPGGAFTLEPVEEMDGPGTGELVYHGRNVMLGYAEASSDLGLGRTVNELRTGDLARRTANGLYEIVGRRSRLVKIVGLRIDLEQVERALAEQGLDALCTGADGELVVAVAGTGAAGLGDDLAERFGLPRASVRVVTAAELPRLPNGKPDYAAVLSLASMDPAGRETAQAGVEAADVPALVALYSELLGSGDVTPDSSFVDLGGDSLSYVEMSVRLEQVLGHLPAGWHITPIRDLAPSTRRRRFTLRTLETSVTMRAVAILMIVGTHVGVFTLRGGAHALLAVAGYNYARFQLTSAARRARLRGQLTSVARVVVPSVAVIALAFTLKPYYTVANLFLVNNIFGPESWAGSWQFWFVEVLVQLLVVTTALMAIPWVDRLERAHQFGFALGVLGLGIVLRYELVEIGLTHTLPALWLFAYGWALARASAWWQRMLLSVVVLVTVPGFFDDAERNLMTITLLLLLTWAPTVLVPGAVRRIAGVLASASLYIYLVHWLVYPHVRPYSGWLALAVSVLAGIGYWLLAARAVPAMARAWRARR